VFSLGLETLSVSPVGVEWFRCEEEVAEVTVLEFAPTDSRKPRIILIKTVLVTADRRTTHFRTSQNTSDVTAHFLTGCGVHSRRIRRLEAHAAGSLPVTDANYVHGCHWPDKHATAPVSRPWFTTTATSIRFQPEQFTVTGLLLQSVRNPAHCILVTDDKTLRQWLIATRHFGWTIAYQWRFYTWAPSALYLVFSIKTIQGRHTRGQSTVAQVINSTQKFIAVFTKARDSSICSTPTQPHLSTIHHLRPGFHNGTWLQHLQTNICRHFPIIPVNL
jgi:hypothetical protein